MWLKYAKISPSSSSLRFSSAKLGIRCSGQTRTERGSRISARKPASVKYSVGFFGKFRSGPADADPAWFIVWHVKHLFTKMVCLSRRMERREHGINRERGPPLGWRVL